MIKRYCLLFTIIASSISVFSQAKIGQWTDHLSFNKCLFAESEASSVLGVGSNGFFRLSTLDNSIEKYSKVNHLTGTVVSAINVFADDSFIVGYEDGVIDLIVNGTTYTMYDLSEKVMSGSKKINSFYFYNGKIYACTDFGVILIDIVKKEFVNTFYVGDEGASVEVYQMTVFNDSFYLATSSGIRKATTSSNLLWYYGTWRLDAAGAFYGIASSNGNLIAVSKSTNYSVSALSNGVWTAIGEVSNFKRLHENKYGLLVACSSVVYSVNDDLSLSTLKSSISLDGVAQLTPSFNDAFYSDDKSILWIADNNYGLLKCVSGSSDQSFVPDGPGTNNNQSLVMDGKTLLVAPGTRTSGWNNGYLSAQAYIYNGTWTNLSSATDNLFANLWDVIGVVPDPLNSGRYYFNSWGNGIFVVDKNSVVTHYNQNNSPLESIYDTDVHYIRVGGIVFDKENNLIATNSYRSNGIVVKDVDDNWYKYSYKSLQWQHTMSQLVEDDAGNIWGLILRSANAAQGLFVFNTNGTIADQTDDVYKSPLSSTVDTDSRFAGQLRVWDKNYNDVTNDVVCLTKDKNGYLWLGTGKGVLVNYSPKNVFKETYPVFKYIEVPREDDPLYVDYLLENERINCIAVDEANRKWIGTEASGVYLVSADGTETIEHFTTDNSPLFTDAIVSIAINSVTGDVYFGTGKGILSYRGTSITGSSNLENIHAYPNPVTHQYKGDIVVTGLIEDSNVKIVDVSGKLVYETTSLGGQCEWNGCNLFGNRVTSGVYVVLVTSNDGTYSGSTKILIVN